MLLHIVAQLQVINGQVPNLARPDGPQSAAPLPALRWQVPELPDEMPDFAPTKDDEAPSNNDDDANEAPMMRANNDEAPMMTRHQ